MKLVQTKLGALLLGATMFMVSCNNDDNADYQLIESTPLAIEGEVKAATFYYDNEGPHEHSHDGKIATGFTETFETDSKTSYSAGYIQVNSGDWYLSDALLGTSSRDRRYGSKAIRMRNSGYAIMDFDLDNGASSVTVRHAKYGSDGTSTWRLIASFNGGDWVYVGNTITTSSTALNTVKINVNATGRVRFGIQKLSGGSNRVNFDNIEIEVSGGNSGGDNDNTGVASRDSNIAFGNPSNAGSSVNNYYLSRADYALSYNNSRGTANWVSWHLSSAWMGSARRCNCFKRDTALPSSFFLASTSDYTRSGFDRGHLCPSADRNGSSSSNANTYYMTNIAPQAPDNNQRSWKNLEDYLRSLAQDGNEVYVVAGVAGQGGSGRNGFANTIDGGNITVPDSFWKVAIILPNGSNDINRVNTSTRIIAVNIPNDQGISTSWSSYRTSVNQIERLTGYDLLENIPNSVESILESRVDNGPVN
ncbi:DNA/RNA non-specific endonuclease [Aquimarina rhabdastrellae]